MSSETLVKEGKSSILVRKSNNITVACNGLDTPSMLVLELFNTKPFYSTLHRYEMCIKKCVLFIVLVVLIDGDSYFPDALSYRKSITLLF